MGIDGGRTDRREEKQNLKGHLSDLRKKDGKKESIKSMFLKNEPENLENSNHNMYKFDK